MRREELPAGECLCDHSSGEMLSLFGLADRYADTHEDFDYIRWYLLHYGGDGIRRGGQLVSAGLRDV